MALLGRMERLDGNLLKQVPEKEITGLKNTYKFFILDVLAVASAAFLGYSYYDFLKNGPLLLLATAFFLFLALSAFKVMLIKSFFHRILVLLLESVALLPFFYLTPRSYLVWAAVLFFSVSILGEMSSRSRISNSLEVKFIMFTAPVFRASTVAFILFALLMYIPGLDNNKIFVSQNTFSSMFASSSWLLHDIYPLLDTNLSLKQFSERIALSKLSGTPAYESMAESDKLTFWKNASIQISDQIKKALDGNITDDQKVSDILYKVITDRLSKSESQFGYWFIALWTALVFVIAYSFGYVAWWICALGTLAIYELLIAVNVIAVRGESITKETVMFS
ncbi:MAG: hypothetical protein HY432_03845 [Candidatus Liptonbacteria bacterium]|nr:hypothetical protein [Candidatus Liptonbacteria bacterium]